MFGKDSNGDISNSFKPWAYFFSLRNWDYIGCCWRILIKLLIDLSKLAKNVDETTTIVKTEIEPTLKELNKALSSINAIAQNADKQVDSLSKTLESLLGAGVVAFSRAKNFPGGLLKGLIKGITTAIKLFGKKE